MHTSICTLQTAHCTLHTAHCTLHTAHFTLHTAHCTLHTVNCTPRTAHWTQKTAHCNWKLHNAHFTLQTANCKLHTALLKKTKQENKTFQSGNFKPLTILDASTWNLQYKRYIFFAQHSCYQKENSYKTFMDLIQLDMTRVQRILNVKMAISLSIMK